MLSKAKAGVTTVTKVQEDKIGVEQKETGVESGEILKAGKEEGGEGP